ncbi:GNAT family N-acetyltransferase [Pontibacter sp. G13]|uniref:GNAT family N-acetyltransferase n=1 Tax=Pontibacter sp. G13 TaxID=3074898 RepID=UPI00288AAA0C|nr:GNAT family N-acetyltransferase [Pontibacter sp. G13]WNJ19677.1 GNAT family N-acetyltransferase [Pontibacter sp. G13]
MISAFQSDNSAQVDRMIQIWRSATQVAHPFMTQPFLDKEASNIRNIYILHTQSWIWMVDGEMMAFISMIGNEIGGLFVDPSLHGKGIGTQLVDHVAEMHPTLEVEVFEENALGRPFYEKFGFRPIKRYIHEETQQPVLRLFWEK